MSYWIKVIMSSLDLLVDYAFMPCCYMFWTVHVLVLLFFTESALSFKMVDGSFTALL